MHVCFQKQQGNSSAYMEIKGDVCGLSLMTLRIPYVRQRTPEVSYMYVLARSNGKEKKKARKQILVAEFLMRSRWFPPVLFLCFPLILF